MKILCQLNDLGNQQIWSMQGCTGKENGGFKENE